MEFGFTEHPERVDFGFRADPSGNLTVLPGSAVQDLRVTLGLTGWREPFWKGDIYPTGQAPSQFLAEYARIYNGVELNSTFYSIPAQSVLARWRDSVPPGFRFSPKVPRQISHGGSALPDGFISSFQAAMDHLQPYLGPSFLQLPPAFGQANLGWLDRFLDAWSPEQKLYLEFRNRELLDSPDVLDRLREHGVGLVITDVAGFRAMAHMHLTVPGTLIRFVATGRQGLDRDRINRWSERLDQWIRSGLEEATIFCHHPEARSVPDLSRLWSGIWKETTGYPSVMPGIPGRLAGIQQQLPI